MILEESNSSETLSVFTEAGVLQHAGDQPSLDRHPSFGWILKNKNETLAIGIKMKKY
ncbi:hypothetical protein [Alteribacillus sp. YIM 98480]|uniref:hypothetical protein n=1 Tax=Alteribacillus sp. YIM 98480 TaxID=2606599 RepID=UPI00131D9C90|nr:hypothetical protein [Alteribacillus sp. YIM 98480]